MDRIYSIEDAKNEMARKVRYYENRIAAWKAVKRLYKKSGEPFAVLSKNFENCKFCEQYSSLYVYIYVAGSYDRDEINLTSAARNPYTHKNGETDEITADFVEKCINDLIEKYRGWMEKDMRGLEMIEKQIEEITPELDTLRKEIKKAEENGANYVLQSYIKEYLRIL